MIIQQLHIDGFGKLTDLDITFSENINLIYGDNEAGKSTLCSFIFHMLYGMERSRGRASRFDAYIRFLPWHASTYGGSLTFTADGATWFLERSFLADSRFLRLTRLDDGMIIPHGESMLTELLSHVNEAAYKAMFYVSGHTCADVNALSGILRQYTQNLPGSGSTSISTSTALQNLRQQKKRAVSQLSGTTSGDLFRVQEELCELEALLLNLSSPEGTFDRNSVEDISARHCSGRFHLFISLLLCFLGVLFLIYPPIPELTLFPYATYLPAAIFFLAGLLSLSIFTRKKQAAKTTAYDYSEDVFPSSESDSFTQNSSSTLQNSDILPLIDRITLLKEKKAQLEENLKSDETLQLQIDAYQLAMDTISELSREIHHTYSPSLQHSFIRHASALTGRPFSQLFIDESFHFSLMEDGRLIPVDGLSRGTIEQLMFACRLASIDLLFPGAKPPLLLDDVFSSTDDSRLSVLLTRLNIDYPGQKLVFTCQKREAMILSQLSLSHHLIQL